jgi:hypothetical protein
MDLGGQLHDSAALPPVPIRQRGVELTTHPHLVPGLKKE